MSVEVPAPARAFWEAFVAAAGSDVRARLYEVFHFDDNEHTANALADLVLSGQKRATAGLVWAFEAKGRRLPRAGDLSVVTRWDGEPVCVIETARADVWPFDEVGESFAAAEGEGDRSLEWWRRAHWSFFSRECARIGRTPDPRMPVVCEQFDVVSPLRG